jgi:hypothetical protein
MRVSNGKPFHEKHVFFFLLHVTVRVSVSVIRLTATPVKFGSKNERRGGGGKKNKPQPETLWGPKKP